jgi:hypothetical protein
MITRREPGEASTPEELLVDVFVKTANEISKQVGSSNFKYGSDVSLAIENLAMPVLVELADPRAAATMTQLRIWEKKVDEYVKFRQARNVPCGEHEDSILSCLGGVY